MTIRLAPSAVPAKEIKLPINQDNLAVGIWLSVEIIG